LFALDFVTLWALAAKSGLGYDTLLKQYALELGPSTSNVGSAPDHQEAEYQLDQSAFDQEGGNEIGEDEGNDFYQEGGNEIPKEEGNSDDADGEYGMSESDYEDIDLWLI
uniref:Uncharacterized protein n=1 Tax=Oryza glaberrima TaxID=4538 RepID=I1PKB1_ORYGL